MNRKVLKKIAKWVWIAAVLLFTVFYSVIKRDLIAQAFSMLSAQTMLSAAALILAAKICLAVNMRAATTHFKIILGWRDCFCIYNLTQLAKYIPGSIWQFVGRITIFHERGIEAQSIRDSLIAEHFWVIASALFLACVLVFTNIREFFEAKLANVNYEHLLPWMPIVLVLVVGVLVLSLLVNRRLLSWTLRLFPPWYVIPVLIFTWVFLGASLWVTLAPFVASQPSIFYTIGVYCFSFLAGFLVPFSPAGLGIREAVLMFSLTPFMQPDTAIFLAAINRIIYFAVEVLLSVFCWPQHFFKKKYRIDHY